VSDPFELSQTDFAGTTLAGRYEVGEELGRGAMAIVFAAHDRMLKRPVAIKIVRHEALEDPSAPLRLRREARAVGGLRHRHIITFHDVGEHEGRVFIVMERLRGRTLGDERKRCERLDALRVARIGAQIADALATAHAADIVHRDLKPDNVFVLDQSPDFIKLLDFSVAKLPATMVEGQITSTGAVFGTPNYMAPEQAIGDPVSARSDLYALGTVLFELYAGRPPYQAKNVIQLLTLQSTQDAPDLRSFEGDAPPELAALVAHLLQRRADDRPETAYAVEQSLRSIIERSEREGVAPPPVPRARRRIEGADKTQQGAARDGGGPVAVQAPSALFRAVHLGDAARAGEGADDDAPAEKAKLRHTQPATRRAASGVTPSPTASRPAAPAPAASELASSGAASSGAALQAQEPAPVHAVPRPRRAAGPRSTAPVTAAARATLDAHLARAAATGVKRPARRTQPSWRGPKGELGAVGADSTDGDAAPPDGASAAEDERGERGER
jgi:tRNA A-37 threonylcarbamoyl transferase component Bud32